MGFWGKSGKSWGMTAGLAGGTDVWGEMTGSTEANRINQQNYEAQRDNYAWQRYAQQRTWEREDNAVQRRKADLLAAGLSPVLAAGSAAQTSTPIPTSAPHREYARTNMAEAAMMAYQIMSMTSAIDKTKAESELIDLQKKKTQVDTAARVQDVYNKKMENYIKKVDTKNIIETGIGKESSTVGKLLKDLMSNIRFLNEKGDNSRPATNAAKQKSSKVELTVPDYSEQFYLNK